MFLLLKEELKRRALTMVQIPSHFQPILEELFEGEDGAGEALFAWATDEQGEGIQVNLDLVGNLTGLSIDRNIEEQDTASLSCDEKRQVAEQFLCSHYPDALRDFTFYKSEALTQAVRFEFTQMVMDLPLEGSGCYIDIDPAGSVVGFTYSGFKAVPEIPTAFISKEKLIDHVKSRLDFRLIIANLYTDFHDVAVDGLRLVYEPEPGFMNYKAGVLEPTLTIEHEEEVPRTVIPLLPPANPVMRKDLSKEELIGISERMEIIREVDMGDEIGVVWRDREWEMKEKDLTVDDFFARQTEDTVKAFVSKKTGEVRSFIWFKERSGDFQLNREACYQKAVDFLQGVVPDYYEYLRLIVGGNEEEDDTATKEPFTFYLYTGHDIPIQLELVSVVVNRTTGLIDHYGGPRFDIEQLQQVPTKPTISIKEATERFINQLDFELAWNKNYVSDSETYELTYRACDRFSGERIQYIDAVTGVVICNKI